MKHGMRLGGAPAHWFCVNVFDIALLNCPHPSQALVHVVVDLIRVEVWRVMNPLYQIFSLGSAGILLTDVVLQDAFAP